jgi:hypothetical protein
VTHSRRRSPPLPSGRRRSGAAIPPGRRGRGVAVTGRDRRDGQEPIDDAAAVRDGDVWAMLARARADGSPRALAAAQDMVFRRFLPMARAVAAGTVPTGGPADPGVAERAAESGLARAVARWWSADGAGFDVFASITIAVELDRLSAAASDGGR